MSRKRKKRGHYCWCCQRRRPNEKFSGKGHGKHLCRECAKLGKEELAYLSEERRLDRLMTFGNIIPRRHRKTFEQYLIHENERVRAYAHQLRELSEKAREELRQARIADNEYEAALIMEANTRPVHEESTRSADEYQYKLNYNMDDFMPIDPDDDIPF